MDPVDATGPMRIVLSAFPSAKTAERVGRLAVEKGLAACVQRLPIDSTYRWRGRIESASETLVLFKTVPKRVGALFRLLETEHPYEVPEIVELDVPRVSGRYLQHLASTIDRAAPPPPLGGGRPAHRVPKRPGSRRVPAAPAPGRTPTPRRRP
jgi:periplasmic divalent cation tolerance protein